MTVSTITPVGFNSNITDKNKSNYSAADLTQGFHAMLTDAITSLNEQQATVNQLSDQFVRGELADAHQLIIASETASLGLELTVQLRNKAVESYQEIMRMQI